MPKFNLIGLAHDSAQSFRNAASCHIMPNPKALLIMEASDNGANRYNGVARASAVVSLWCKCVALVPVLFDEEDKARRFADENNDT